MTTTRAVRLVAAVAMVSLVVVVPLAAPPPASAGGGCHLVLGTGGPTQGEGATVELKDVCMSPTVLRADPGVGVTIVNRDATVHNLYGVGLSISELPQGQSAIVRYDRPGTYPFACTLHVGMVGAIVVGDGRLSDAAEVVATTSTAAPVPLAANRPLPSSDRTSSTLPVIGAVALGLGLAAGAAGYRYGRRSAVLSAHDRADR